MVFLQNTFEGGTPGQAITVANSGGLSGDAFTGVGATPLYSSNAAHGSEGYEANAASQTVYWGGRNDTAFAVRFYFRLLATPTAAGIIMRCYNVNTNGDLFRFIVNTSRQVQMQNSNGQTVAFTTVPTLTVGSWYRIEMWGSRSTGACDARVYLASDESLVGSYSVSSGYAYGGSNLGRVDFGRLSGSGWGSGPGFDSLAFQDAATQIGPFATAPVQTAVLPMDATSSFIIGGTTGPNVINVPAPSGGDDQAALQAVFDQATQGTTIIFPTNATYKHSGKLNLTGAGKSNVVIQGNGSTLTATTPAAASFGVYDGANNVSIDKLKHVVTGATSRINNGFDVAPFVFSNVTLGTLSDLTSEGSAGLGYYFWKAQGGSLLRIISRNSLADGIHFTAGSGGFTGTDCQSINAGDDGFAHIGYLSDGAEAGRPHDITLVRPYVLDSRARGISYAGARDCTATDPNIDGSLAANVYFAVERGDFNTGQTDRCTVSGSNTRLARAGTSYPAIPNGTNGTGLDQGAVLFLSSGSGAAVTDCGITQPNIGQLASVNYDTIRAISYSGGTFSGCFATVVDLYQGCPSTFIGGNTPASISPASSTDKRSTALPAYGQEGGGTGRPPVSVAAFLQLDADSLGAVGSAVSSWVDSVASRALSQATASLQPAVVAGPNGHKGVKFDGDVLSSSLSGQTARAAITVMMVMRLDAVATVARSGIISAANADNANDYEKTSGGWYLTNPNATSETAFSSMPIGGAPTGTDINAKTSSQPLGQWVIITALLSSDGVAQQVYTNGTAEGVSPTGQDNADLTFNRLNIGSRYYATVTDYGKFSLTHARMYPGRLSAADRASAHSDLSDRYGITVSDYLPNTVEQTATVAATVAGALLIGAAVSTAAVLPVSATSAASFGAQQTTSGAVVAAAASSAAFGAAVQPQAAVAMAGSGILAVAGTKAVSGSMASAATAQMAVAGTKSVTGALVAVGTGSLAVAGLKALTGALAVSGSSAMAVAGSTQGTNQVLMAATGSMAVAGSGAVSAVLVMDAPDAAAFAGSLSISAVLAAAATGTAAFAGTRTQPGAVAMAGVGTMTPSGSLTKSATLAAPAAASLAVAGNANALGSLVMAAQGTYSMSTQTQAAVAAVAAGALAVAPLVSRVGALACAASATMAVDATVARLGAWAVAGQGSLAVAGLKALQGTVVLASLYDDFIIVPLSFQTYLGELRVAAVGGLTIGGGRVVPLVLQLQATPRLDIYPPGVVIVVNWRKTKSKILFDGRYGARLRSATTRTRIVSGGVNAVLG